MSVALLLARSCLALVFVHVVESFAQGGGRGLERLTTGGVK
jgi:hypothetical protein